MRRAIKYPDSEIIKNNIKYIPNNTANNKKIAAILFKEQKNFCAYTDEYLSRADARDIDHFNPTLKNTEADNYYNWFLIKTQWNKEKSNKWKNYQPVLHPTADDFEERVVYAEGDYVADNKSDIEAKNVISLLKLDDAALADERKRYIKRKHEEIKIFEQDAATFFAVLIKEDPSRVCYLRAIKEEFKVDVWKMLDE
jgi:hypothetical protein